MARGEKPQQHSGIHLIQPQMLLLQPPAQREQVERVGASSARRVMPVTEIAQIVIDQPQADRGRASQHPAVVTRLDTELAQRCHETRIPHTHRQPGNHTHYGVSGPGSKQD